MVVKGRAIWARDVRPLTARTNASMSKDDDVMSITTRGPPSLLADRRARGPAKRPARQQEPTRKGSAPKHGAKIKKDAPAKKANAKAAPSSRF